MLKLMWRNKLLDACKVFGYLATDRKEEIMIKQA